MVLWNGGIDPNGDLTWDAASTNDLEFEVDGAVFGGKNGTGIYDELIARYRHIRLCQINRTVVVNCNMIRGYASGKKRGRYMIILKPEFNKNLPEGSELYFNITKEYIDSLKVLFEKI